MAPTTKQAVTDEKPQVTSQQSEEKSKNPSEEMVSVEKSKLEALFSRMERLEAAASKSALAHFDEKNREAPGMEVRVRHIDGKIVVGEKMTKNVVEKSPQGVWREDQEVEVTFRDGSKSTMPFVYYTRAYKHIVCPVINKSQNMLQADIDALGEFLFKLRLEGNDVIEVGSKFVN